MLPKKAELGEKGKQTRERLVARGFSLFIKKGVADVSLDDILRFSGVKKGAFYYYFDTKEQFLRACFEECYVEAAEEALAEFAAEEACSVADLLYFFTHYAVRVKAKMDDRLGEDGVELDDVYANISYISKQSDFMSVHYADFHEKQRLYVERCLLRMRERGLVAEDANCAELARLMCCCREGAVMMRLKNEDMDFDGIMATFMRYFERLMS